MKRIIILTQSELVYCVANIYLQHEWPEPKISMAILRGWPKVCVRVCVCACVRAQATSCVTFWSVRGATVRHTPTLHGATASTAHSASSDQHITPVLLHHTSSLTALFGFFLHAILTLTCPTTAPFPSLISWSFTSFVNDQYRRSLSLGRYESAESVLLRAQRSDKTQSITVSFSPSLLFFCKYRLSVISTWTMLKNVLYIHTCFVTSTETPCLTPFTKGKQYLYSILSYKLCRIKLKYISEHIKIKTGFLKK